MNSILSIVASIVVGSLLLLSIGNFSLALTDDYNRVLQNLETTQQSSAIKKIIYNDMINIGLGINNQEDAMVTAQQNSISFVGDIDNDNAPELVTYSLSDSAMAAFTKNERDRFLLRSINNGQAVVLATGVTKFDLEYLDFPSGNTTADLTVIKTIDITLEIQSTEPVNDVYSSMTWNTRISPPNLRRY